MGFSVDNASVGLLWDVRRPESIPAKQYHVFLLLLFWTILRHTNEVVFQHMEPSFARLGAAFKEAAALWQFRFPSGDRYVVTYWCNDFVSKTGVPVRARTTSSGASARDREAPWGPACVQPRWRGRGMGVFRWEAKRERWCWRKDAASASGFGGGDAAEGKGVGLDMGAAAIGREEPRGDGV